MNFTDLVEWESEQQIFSGLHDGGGANIEKHKELYGVLHHARTEIEKLRKEVAELREFKGALSALRQLVME